MTYTLTMGEQFTCSRRPEDVFDYITDFSRITEWDKSIVSADKLDVGAIGLGTRFSVVYSMGLRKTPIDYEITTFESPGLAVLSGSGPSFSVIDTVTITPMEGGCAVEWHAELEFRGAAAKVIPLIKNTIIKTGRQTIRDLALALEDDFPSPTLPLKNKIADKLVLPGLTSFTKFGYQCAKRRWNPVTNSVKGKHIVITGATSGLGLATSFELAHRGAHLTLVARNKEKAEAVQKDIEQQTGNTHITLEIADLGEINQVIGLATRLLAQKRPIDVLINNAGALLNPRQENSEGLEASFALLLLSPVILTEQLKPLLSAAAGKNGASRVINVSSGGMYAKRISTSNLESTKGEYSGADAYARSKRGLVMVGEYWADTWTNESIVVHSMHPGWAKTPGVEQSLPDFNRKMQKTLRTSEQGADTTIWLACASEVLKTSGQFWLDRAPHSTHLTNKTRATPTQRSALFKQLNEYGMRYDISLWLGE